MSLSLIEYAICENNPEVAILQEQVCDKIPDCPDGEDETYAMKCTSEYSVKHYRSQDMACSFAIHSNSKSGSWGDILTITISNYEVGYYFVVIL